MAKKSMIARDKVRVAKANRYKTRRETFKKILANPELGFEEKWEAMIALQKLPRNSSPSRQRNRCTVTGRPRGYLRKFGLCRNKLRQVVLNGDAPGVVKSSW